MGTAQSAEVDRPVLAVYVVWHPGCQQAAGLASTIFKTLCANPEVPASRGLGLPVRFRTSTSAAEVPSPIPFDAAQRSAVFIMADDLMVADPTWRAYVCRVATSVGSSHRVIPVAITATANLPPELSMWQGVSLGSIPDGQQETALLNYVMDDLCRFLSPDGAKVKVFLSHSKQDGLEITQAVRQHLHDVARLDDFFDTTDIPDGTAFADVLRQQAGSLHVLLAVQTDTYASREWCRLEVLEAKRQRVPVIVLAAVENRESRSFPYIGNVPVVRWQGSRSLPAVVGALLGEVLRSRYFPLRVKAISKHRALAPDDHVLASPPELVTVLAYRADQRARGQGFGRWIYPDPLLGSEELELLRELDPNFEPITPTVLLATQTTDVPTRLDHRITVGVSVSEPSADELVALGLSELHVRHAFIEIVRHVLAQGGSIAYGGDLRAAGYTHALFDLVRTYNPRDLTGPERVRAVLAWPIGLGLTAAERADLANVATIDEVARPDGSPPSLPPVPERNPEELLWNSRSLTTMRQQMTSAIGARVVVGGRAAGQQGLLPGVIEEAALAIEATTPLYVIGGFGGCGRVLVDALRGSTPDELTLDYQLANTPRYSELYDQAASVELAPSFDDVRRRFSEAGVEGLNNGLDRPDNERLFTTDNADEVVALLLRGLRQV